MRAKKPPLRQVVTTARRFYLERSRDPSGVSGVGTVADGCEFPSGKIALAWRGSWPSVAIYDSMKHVLAVHGHEGDTQVVWLDEWPTPEDEVIRELATPEKLRYIARSLDLLTAFMQRILEGDLITVEGEPLGKDERDSLLEWVNGSQQQDDLLAWAKALED